LSAIDDGARSEAVTSVFVGAKFRNRPSGGNQKEADLQRDIVNLPHVVLVPDVLAGDEREMPDKFDFHMWRIVQSKRQDRRDHPDDPGVAGRCRLLGLPTAFKQGKPPLFREYIGGRCRMAELRAPKPITFQESEIDTRR
jgi:hypothetical protein